MPESRHTLHGKPDRTLAMRTGLGRIAFLFESTSMTTWRNVAGSYTIELGLDDDSNLIDLGSEKDLEFLRPFIADPDGKEVTINFLSSGSYQAASMYGGADGLGWPEDGEEDREFDSAQVLTNGVVGDSLPAQIGQRLFEMYETHVKEVELELERS